MFRWPQKTAGVPVGIDLGRRVVRAACVIDDEARQVQTAWWAGASAVDLIEILRATGMLREIRAHGAVVCPPREQLILESVALPRLPRPAVFTAAVGETARRHGFDPGELECRVCRPGVTSGDGREEQWIVLAMPRVTVDRIRETFLGAGARQVAVVTHVEALARIAIETAAGIGPAYRVLVEADTAASTLLLLHHDDIAACRHLVIGGDDLDHAVADRLRLDLESASALRRRRLGGMRTLAAGDRAAYEASRGLIRDLVADVRVGLGRIGASFRGPTPTEILLVGSEAGEPGLAEKLAAACGVPVRAAIAPGVAGDDPRTRWAVATGLSLSGRDGSAAESTRWRAA
ncbi:MAG: hypothetical protein GY715_17160 [Planctomycetes bacterium]|nr:hypothetical protein [Planctomycetota bacterium]